MTRNLATRNLFIAMSRLTFVLLFFSCQGMAQRDSEIAPASGTPIAFLHVTVIDVMGGQVRRNYTIVVKGGLIEEMGAAERITLPKEARIVDGTDKFVIPGLWDMHVHVGSNAPLLPLYVANGVTGVRSMADSREGVNKFRHQIAEGQIAGPRIIATAGEIIDGPHEVWPGSVSAASESEGKSAVDTVVSHGSEFAKVYDMLPRSAYFGIAEQAKRKNFIFVGHIPMSVSAAEASDAGQKSVEHLIGIPLACSLKEAYLRQEVFEAERKAESAWPALRAYRRADSMAFYSYSPQKADALFSLFVKNGTWVVPTLTNSRAAVYSDDKEFTSDSRLKYMPESLMQFWRPNEHSHDLTAEERLLKNSQLQRYLDIVGAMHREGVEILAGTDSPNAFSFPGFGLHDELKLLVKAGFSPLEALQSATRDSARFMGLLDSYGTVDKGKVADFVLLDADPTKDINNIDKIRAVVIGGRLFTEQLLQQILQESAAAR